MGRLKHIRFMNLVIIGSGPAGLSAAIAAARGGAAVTIVEQLDKPALKLLASGGGRCNLTNLLARDEFMRAFGRRGGFMRPALDAMDAQGLRNMLEGLNVPTESPDGVHVYPASNRSKDVLAALLTECDRLNARLMLATRAREVVVHDGRVEALQTSNGVLRADALLIATGGRGYPQLGGGESGYGLARGTGHRIIEPKPALVGLVTRETWPGACAGVSLNDAEIAINAKGASRRRGAILFTHKGVSGPAVLDISGDISELLAKHAPAKVEVRLKLTLDDERAWLARLDEARRSHGKKTLGGLLSEAIPARLGRTVCDLAGADWAARCAHLGAVEAKRIAAVLSGAPLTVTGTEGWPSAMVTRGGVDLAQVDPKTLESRLVRGLYFAGEIVDLDGPSGGFNLQWAFSSGWLAGLAVSNNCG